MTYRAPHPKLPRVCSRQPWDVGSAIIVCLGIAVLGFFVGTLLSIPIDGFGIIGSSGLDDDEPSWLGWVLGSCIILSEMIFIITQFILPRFYPWQEFKSQKHYWVHSSYTSRSLEDQEVLHASYQAVLNTYYDEDDYGGELFARAHRVYDQTVEALDAKKKILELQVNADDTFVVEAEHTLESLNMDIAHIKGEKV